MRQKLLKVASVTKVNLYGVQDERIFVEFSHAKLATLGIVPRPSSIRWQSRMPWSPRGPSRRARNAYRCA
jgi:hypothetical protein